MPNSACKINARFFHLPIDSAKRIRYSQIIEDDRELDKELNAMTNTKELIILCQDLCEDETLEIPPAVKDRIRHLTFAAIGECKSLERELGPAAYDKSFTAIQAALEPIRQRLFGRSRIW